MPPKFKNNQLPTQIKHHWYCQQCSWHWNGIYCRCSSSWTDRNELPYDVLLHQILCWLTAHRPWMPASLKNWEPIWLDEDNKLTGENQLLWKAYWQILQIRGRRQQWGSSLLPWCQFLKHTHHRGKHNTISYYMLYVLSCYMSCSLFLCHQTTKTFSTHAPCFWGFTETTKSMSDQTEKLVKSNDFLNKKESISILVETQ